MKNRIILELEDIEKLIAKKYEIKSPLSINYTPLDFDGIYAQQESLEIEFTGKEKELIKAIPSSEPREVLYSGDGYADGEMVYDMAECPSCGEKYEDDEPAWKYAKFCMKCGQAISWEMEWEAEGEEE